MLIKVWQSSFFGVFRQNKILSIIRFNDCEVFSSKKLFESFNKISDIYNYYGIYDNSKNIRYIRRIAEEIGQTAISSGYDSYFAYGRLGRPSKSTLIRIGGNTDIKLHGIESMLLDKHGFGSKAATKKFIAEVERIQPDIINLHNIHGYYLNVEILFEYLAKKNIPIVWTLHDCWPFTGHS